MFPVGDSVFYGGKNMSKYKVYFFEDTEKEQKRILSDLRLSFAPLDVEVVPFMKIEGNEGKPHYQAIESVIGEKALRETRLIIADHDLSCVEGGGGLSAESIKTLANKYWIPVVLYSQGANGKKFLEEQQKLLSDYSIVLDASKSGFASECKSIFSGYQQILEKCLKNKKMIQKSGSPATSLSQILEKPEYEPHLSLYSIGNTNFINNVMAKAASKRDGIEKQMSVMLGYWLYTSILRYPGVIVSDEVASSFLDIGLEEFKKDDVRKLFVPAKYGGPFSEVGSYWWRYELQKIYVDANCTTGGEYANKKLKRKVKPCLCSRASGAPHSAGYYCMVSNKPICSKHSRSESSWFPKGADLARISETVYRKLGPRLGL